MIVPFSLAKYPPAPVLAIQLSPPEESPQTDTLPALIDTGSDFSLAPRPLLSQIRAPKSRTALIRGLWSPRQIITLFLVDIHLPHGVLPSVEVAGISEKDGDFETEEIVLGRNVLNMLNLLLAGPSATTQILERIPRRF